MPNYDYKCGSCEEVMEVFHSMSESPEIKCSKCGASAFKMISGGVGIAFKGSGFYVTDSKSSSSSKSE